MGKKGKRDRQASMWVATADLPKSAGHPFYAQLNRVLDDAGFDTFVEAQCAQCYADGIGRPSLAPGRYVRLLLLGYCEGLDSERAIAWRAADSLSIRQFLDFALHEAPPDHSTLSRTRRLIDVETHQAVFTWVLQRLADAHLVEEVHFLWRPTLTDPRDEFILELAVAAGCQAIVTHNVRDFRRADAFEVLILTPAEFLRQVEEAR